MSLPTGREAKSLEAEIKKLRQELDDLKEEKKTAERLAREYRKKRVGATYIIRAQTEPYLCQEGELDKRISDVLKALRDERSATKNEA